MSSITRNLSGALALILLGACGGEAPDVPAEMFARDGVVIRLTGETGLEPGQVAGGLGALLGMVDARANAADHAALVRMFPNAHSYYKVASDAGISLGDVADVGDLDRAMGDLGIGSDERDRLKAAVEDYVARESGPAARERLQQLL